MSEVAVIVIAKEPRPGHVKTRLCPPCDARQASDLARAALADTLTAVAATTTSRRVLALDGEAGTWLARGIEVIPQRGEGLAERLSSALEDVGGPALVVGMDTPQITRSLLNEAIAKLAQPSVNAVLGPALDGGYWAVGLREPDARIFKDVPMSAPETYRAQRARLAELGLCCERLPPLRDVDTFEDALAVARAAPGSRFAKAMERVAAHGVRADAHT